MEPFVLLLDDGDRARTIALTAISDLCDNISLAALTQAAVEAAEDHLARLDEIFICVCTLEVTLRLRNPGEILRVIYLGGDGRCRWQNLDPGVRWRNASGPALRHLVW